VKRVGESGEELGRERRKTREMEKKVEMGEYVSEKEYDDKARESRWRKSAVRGKRAE
jgi:hypothetical protein